MRHATLIAPGRTPSCFQSVRCPVRSSDSWWLLNPVSGLLRWTTIAAPSRHNGNANRSRSLLANCRDTIAMSDTSRRRSLIPFAEPPERTSIDTPGFSPSKRRTISVISGYTVEDPVMTSDLGGKLVPAEVCAPASGGTSDSNARAAKRNVILVWRSIGFSRYPRCAHADDQHREQDRPAPPFPLPRALGRGVHFIGRGSRRSRTGC